MKLGDHKARKVSETDFWKKFLIWIYSQKGLQISPKSDTFLKNGSNNLFWFLPEVTIKCDLQFEWNLFLRKNCDFEIFDLEIVKMLPKLKLLAIFSTLYFFFYFPHNDRWCLVDFWLIPTCVITIRQSSQCILITHICLIPFKEKCDIELEVKIPDSFL